MKVWLTTTAHRTPTWLPSTEPLLALARRNLEVAPVKRFTLAASPETADAIVYVEPEYTKMREYYELYFSEDLVRRFPNRCFAIDCADTSWALAPGVYTHLRAGQTDVARFRAGGFLRMYNTRVEEVWRGRSSARPRLRMSFRGAVSAPVRERMLEVIAPSDGVAMTRTDVWFKHTDDSMRAYLDEMRDSAFVLCPRGLGPATYRLFEAMQLGRVPVILSDEWVPPHGAPWADVSIRVAESRVRDLPAIVAEHEPVAAEMGAAARRAWEEWFAPDVVFYRSLQAIESILLERPASHDEGRIDWRSLAVQWRLGWTMPQKVAAAVRRGDAVDRAKQRLRRIVSR